MAEKSTKTKFTRTPGGTYILGEWSISPTEGEDRSPGYTWFAHSTDAGEFYFGSLKSAKTFVSGKFIDR
jgi:hypothetical protein